jgi:hypothetical protein
MDRGDGNDPVHITKWDDVAKAIVYATDGVKTIRIWRKIAGFNFDLALVNNNANKIKNIINVGPLELVNPGAFSGSSNLTWSAIDALNKNSGLPPDMSNFCKFCFDLVEIESANASDWSNVLNAESLFDGCVLLNQEFNLATTHNVTNWKRAFGSTFSQSLPIVASYLAATSIFGILQGALTYNHPIGGPSPSLENAENALKEMLLFNDLILFTWESCINLNSFLEKSTSYDRNTVMALSTTVLSISMARFLKDTDFDSNLDIVMNKVADMSNFAQGNFTMSVATWDYIIDMIHDQLSVLQTDVRIDAEAKHSANRTGKINQIVAQKSWIWNDGGVAP